MRGAETGLPVRWSRAGAQGVTRTSDQDRSPPFSPALPLPPGLTWSSPSTLPGFHLPTCRMRPWRQCAVGGLQCGFPRILHSNLWNSKKSILCDSRLLKFYNIISVLPLGMGPADISPLEIALSAHPSCQPSFPPFSPSTLGTASLEHVPREHLAGRGHDSCPSKQASWLACPPEYARHSWPPICLGLAGCGGSWAGGGRLCSSSSARWGAFRHEYV